MPHINLPPSAGTDDAHERADNGNVINNATEVLAMAVGTFFAISAFRFVSVQIPQGATILSAYFSGTPKTTAEDDANGTIFGEDVDNSAAFNIGTATFDLTARTKTSASVSWVASSLGTNRVFSPDITTILQEIVDRAGWAKGNALTLLMTANTGATLTLWPRNVDVARCPFLTVSFSVGDDGQVFTVRAVQADAATGGGTQDLTISGFGTPQLAIVSVNVATSDGTPAAHASMSFGVFDGSYQGVECTRARDAQGTSETDKNSVRGSVIQILNASGTTIDAEASASFITNGIRLTWSNAPGAAYKIRAVLFKGLTEYAAGDTPLLPSATSLIRCGFSPDAILTSHAAGTMQNVVTTGFEGTFGLAIPGITQRSMGWVSGDALPAADSYGLFGEASIFLYPFGASLGRQANVTAFNTLDVSVQRVDADAGTSAILWVALKLPASVGRALLTVDTPTATGDQTISSLSFQPQALIGFSSWATAAGSTPVAGQCACGFFAMTASEEVAQSQSDLDNADPTVSKSYAQSKALAQLDQDGTLGYEAARVSLNSNGWTWNFSTVDGSARKVMVLALGAEAGGSLIPSRAHHQPRVYTRRKVA